MRIVGEKCAVSNGEDNASSKSLNDELISEEGDDNITNNTLFPFGTFKTLHRQITKQEFSYVGEVIDFEKKKAKIK